MRLIPRWEPASVSSLRSQWRFFRRVTVQSPLPHSWGRGLGRGGKPLSLQPSPPTPLPQAGEGSKRLLRRQGEELVLIQVGNRVEAYEADADRLRALRPRAQPATRPGFSRVFSLPLKALAGLRRQLRRQGIAHRFIAEEGYLRGGLKRRVLRLIWRPASPPIPSPPTGRPALPPGPVCSPSTAQESPL